MENHNHGFVRRCPAERSAPPQSTAHRGRPSTGLTPRRCFRMSHQRVLREIREAAEFEEMSPSAWMRKTLYRTALNTG